jgi:hypothetical protein
MQRLMLSAAIAATTLALTTGTALAGEIVAVPDTVPAPGEATFELTLSGFSPETTIFVVPCEAPAGGDPDDIDPTTCDLENATGARSDTEGTARLTATWDVPAGGLAILVGNEARTEAANLIVPIGDTQVLGSAQGNPDGQLPETGGENLILAGIGLTMVAAGVVSHHAGLSLGSVLTARRRPTV